MSTPDFEDIVGGVELSEEQRATLLSAHEVARASHWARPRGSSPMKEYCEKNSGPP